MKRFAQILFIGAIARSRTFYEVVLPQLRIGDSILPHFLAQRAGRILRLRSGDCNALQRT